MRHNSARLGRLVRAVLYALPVALIMAMVGTYGFAPKFYLDIVLSFEDREEQIVEIFTFLCAISAAATLALSAWMLWRLRRASRVRGGAMIIAVLASVLPAIRASRLHPVEALRYE